MKQLLFNILLIVGSALLFIQCAKLFSKGGKISGHPSQISPVNNKQNKHSTGTMAASNTINRNTGYKNETIIPFFNNPVPYKVTVKINAHRILYNPYIFYNSYFNLSGYDIVNKYGLER